MQIFAFLFALAAALTFLACCETPQRRWAKEPLGLAFLTVAWTIASTVAVGYHVSMHPTGEGEVPDIEELPPFHRTS